MRQHVCNVTKHYVKYYLQGLFALEVIGKGHALATQVIILIPFSAIIKLKRILSGSGFFIKRGPIWILKGITSFIDQTIPEGNLGCDVSKYSAFTNVYKFNEWIKEIVDNHLEK